MKNNIMQNSMAGVGGLSQRNAINDLGLANVPFCPTAEPCAPDHLANLNPSETGKPHTDDGAIDGRLGSSERHNDDCDYHADQFPHECTCGLMALLRQQHEAMADVMQLRRLSENQRQRDKANAAIAVWWRVNAFLKRKPMPTKHQYWSAGEVGCPDDIKAGNGEIHTLRCKVCGIDDPKDDRCLGVKP